MKYLKYFFGAFVFFGGAAIAMGAFSVPTTTHTINTFQPPYSFFNGATTTGTASLQQATSSNTTDGSGILVVAGAKKVTMFFGHGGTATTSTGTSTFQVQGTADMVNWYNIKFMESTSTTLMTKVTVGAATSTIPYTLSVTDAYYAIRCIVDGGGTVGNQGEHTCRASAEF